MFSQIPTYADRASKKFDFYARSALNSYKRIPLNFLDRQIIRDLKQDGVSLRHLGHLNFQETAGFLASVESALAHLPSATEAQLSTNKKYLSSHRVWLGGDTLLQYPEIVLWGLQERLLNLVEAYFQQPAAYLGCVLIREIPNQLQSGVRLWHRDGEDYSVVKVLIYLNSVDEQGGPFEYIPRKLSPSYRPFRGQKNIIDDATMANVVPQRLWEKCTGPEGTIIFADTANVFHHASIPQRERLAVTFAYTSAKPKNLDMARKFFVGGDTLSWKRLEKQMSSRQQQVALGWR